MNQTIRIKIICYKEEIIMPIIKIDSSIESSSLIIYLKIKQNILNDWKYIGKPKIDIYTGVRKLLYYNIFKIENEKYGGSGYGKSMLEYIMKEIIKNMAILIFIKYLIIELYVVCCMLCVMLKYFNNIVFVNQSI